MMRGMGFNRGRRAVDEERFNDHSSGIRCVAWLLLRWCARTGYRPHRRARIPSISASECEGRVHRQPRLGPRRARKRTSTLYVTPRIDVLSSTRNARCSICTTSRRSVTAATPADVQNEDGALPRLGAERRPPALADVRLRAAREVRLHRDPSVDEGGFTVREDRSYILNTVDGGTQLRLQPPRPRSTSAVGT